MTLPFGRSLHVMFFEVLTILRSSVGIPTPSSHPPPSPTSIISCLHFRLTRPLDDILSSASGSAIMCRNLKYLGLFNCKVGHAKKDKQEEISVTFRPITLAALSAMRTHRTDQFLRRET
ncbi:hypothetical protein CY34DRAFT_282983 [Suillus luteus UH-Slu-Lm8-n1]|uniref:Secreted protein n=1 Tax=Suillus luteus UH-Slu-Lm8-n1 TaxID=930992 RepID=A0A0D0B0W2_9AGAM|nr:hypothetical protein CY34DRAFT_282983 [Suillus luteus UH-Slu-Lm8-n1]